MKKLFCLILFYSILNIVHTQQWQTVTNAVTPSALRGGNEANGAVLYIARVKHENGVHIGKARPNSREAFIAYGGKELALSNYEVFIGTGQWVKATANSFPLNAIAGGYEANGAPLYIARAVIDGGYHPGKARKNGDGFIPYGGVERIVKDFEVLTSNPVATITRGTYHIRSQIGNKPMDVVNGQNANGNGLHLWDFHGGDAQQFTIEPSNEAGYYYIKTKWGRVLTIKDRSNASGATLYTWDFQGGDNQKWRFINRGNGYYNIESKYRTYIDVKGGGNAIGTPIHLSDYSMWGNNIAQLWKLENMSADIQNTTPNLIVQFDTGGDDLRGGNDNVHLVVMLKSGTQLRFENVNEKKYWGNNSSNKVMRALPAGTKLEDVVGVRIETTFSGGLGGDNWNLDRLLVSVQTGSETRPLYDKRGTPLFRFTGDQRVREFRFSSTLPPAPGRRVMTRFDPAVHGFKFENRFTVPVEVLGFNFGNFSGLCGGMAYAALDYFRAGITIPQQNYMPARGMPLYDYLLNRQQTSVKSNLDKWGEYGFNPGGARNREFFNWGLQLGSGRLGELQSRIDRGEPVPLGLQDCGNDCACPSGKCPGNHQVLAIGYEMGRYRGDLGANIEDLSIFVYDPNYPNRTMTLRPHVDGAMYLYREEGQYRVGACRWRAYFTDMKYTRATPPVIPNNPNELIATFFTGGDDLRGGNDNVHLVLLMRSGATIRHDNVNDKQRWSEGSTQSISRPLPINFRVEDLIGVRIETTFGGGIGGDNWDLKWFKFETKLNGNTHTSFDNLNRDPLFRFTGDQKAHEIRF